MIFVDTSFWVALGTPRDDRHEQARMLWAGASRPLTTSNHVLGETWTFVNRRHGHKAAFTMVNAVRGSTSVAVEHISAELEDQAWKWLADHDEREYSFVDATSFALMRRHRIREAYAFDGDFTAAGFVEVRP